MADPSDGGVPSGWNGRRKALIIANDVYEHEGLGQLLAPSADAEALSRVLGDPQIGGFDVRAVHNEPAHVVQEHIEDVLTESRPDDVVLLHFSCHGLKSDSGDLFFAARNTRPTRLGSTAVSADFVLRCMRASRSRSIVLFLDCCYGGAFTQGVSVRASGDAQVLDAFPTGKLGGGRGRVVITASSSMEYAFEDNALSGDHSERPSLFTNAVVEGLSTGDADRDEDGWVSLNELYDYVFDRVQEQNPHQTPSRDVQMQGELYLARSRRRRVRARPIPADLDAARTDPNMYSRVGAVSELRSRLTSDDLPVALGAYEALAEMARTDVRFVAEPAAAAVHEATLRPSDTEVHFGGVPQGSEPPHRTVLLTGPPIARVCTARAVEQWIHVRETDEGVDIWVDVVGAGTLSGSIELKGPTGVAAVAVVVEGLEPGTQPHPVPLTVPPPRPQPTAARVFDRDGPDEPLVSISLTGNLASWLWVVMPLLSCGFLACVPSVFAAKRLRQRRFRAFAWAYGTVWLMTLAANAVTAATVPEESPAYQLAVWLWLTVISVAVLQAWRVRRRVFEASRHPSGS